MDSNTCRTFEVDLKDLLFVIVKRIWIAVLVGIIVAGCLIAYKVILGANDSNVLDVSVKLNGESDYAYSERILNVQRAEDIIKSIDAINIQIENQRNYELNSIIMQIDPMDEAVTTVQYLVAIDDSTTGIDNAIVSSYAQALKAGDYFSPIANKYGTEPKYLKELVSVAYNSSSSVVVSPEDAIGSMGTITITVIGPNIDFTNGVMDCILEKVESEYEQLNGSVPHELVLVGRQDSYMVDNNTRDLQYNATNRFETLQKQIITYEDSLDEIASDIGVKDKSNLYSYFCVNDKSKEQSTISLGSILKYFVIGLAFGGLIVVFIVIVNYFFGKRFSSQAKFFSRFSYVRKIGVTKPTERRSVFAAFIDRKTGDDNCLSDVNNNKIIAANVNNMTSGMSKLLFTGTAEESRVKELVSKLGVKGDVKDNLFTDPSSLEHFSEYDGVIIVEQRNYSDCKMIEEELRLIANSGIQLIGAIIV